MHTRVNNFDFTLFQRRIVLFLNFVRMLHFVSGYKNDSVKRLSLGINFDFDPAFAGTADNQNRNVESIGESEVLETPGHCCVKAAIGVLDAVVDRVIVAFIDFHAAEKGCTVKSGADLADSAAQTGDDSPLGNYSGFFEAIFLGAGADNFIEAELAAWRNDEAVDFVAGDFEIYVSFRVIDMTGMQGRKSGDECVKTHFTHFA